MVSDTENGTCREERLWVRFQSGDRKAFEKIYFDYASLLAAACSNITADRDLVKDCIHDLFVELWKNRSNLSVPQSTGAYLRSCIRRKVIRQISKENRRAAAWPVEETEADPLEKKIIASQAMERRISMRSALESLTKRQKEAVYLRFYDNLDYKQIADRMCITRGSIYNLISKAIDALRPGLKSSLR